MITDDLRSYGAVAHDVRIENIMDAVVDRAPRRREEALQGLSLSPPVIPIR
jgi:hypothetical protein